LTHPRSIYNIEILQITVDSDYKIHNLQTMAIGANLVELGDVARIRSGLTFRNPSAQLQGGPVRAIQVRSMQTGPSIALNDADYTHDSTPEHFLREGDIVFRARGSRLEAAVWNPDGRPTVAGAPLLVITPQPEKLLPSYLAWVINSDHRVRRQLTASARGSATVQAVTAEDLRQLRVACPPLEVQQMVVGIDELQRRAGQLEATIMQRHALLAQAAQQFVLTGRPTIARVTERKPAWQTAPSRVAPADRLETKEPGMAATQAEINNVLWRACDTFRGVVDPDAYKNYILMMLFVKYISDVWREHKETIEAKYKGKPEMVERALKRERFQLPEKATFEYLYEHRNDADVGEKIDKALAAIEDANRPKLDGVFRDISFNSDNLGNTKDRNRRLKNLLEDFSDKKLDFRPSVINEDVVGNGYMYLIEKFAANSGKKGGEFYTPTSVSILLAKLVNPQPGNRIFDPTCGSCSLLIRAAEQVHENGEPSKDYALYGQESNGQTWALGRMNLFLHGKDDARIDWCDTINNPTLLENDRLMKFHIVVANPPFSLDKWGAEHAGEDRFKRFDRGIPPKSKGDYAFILHMIETALPREGRVGVIVPHGVLFRGGGEGKIRKALIEENVLDAVIGLPENLFFGTGIPAAILVFDRSREEGAANHKRKDVLFIDASREFTSGKNQNDLSNEHIDKIIATYRERKAIDKYSAVAKPKDIAENDYNLNIPRYVDTFEEEEEIDLRAVQAEIKQLEGELAETRKKLDGYLKELGV
jgi:type I restriction enzyme M protein